MDISNHINHMAQNIVSAVHAGIGSPAYHTKSASWSHTGYRVGGGGGGIYYIQCSTSLISWQYNYYSLAEKCGDFFGVSLQSCLSGSCQKEFLRAKNQFWIYHLGYTDIELRSHFTHNPIMDLFLCLFLDQRSPSLSFSETSLQLYPLMSKFKVHLRQLYMCGQVKIGIKLCNGFSASI